MKDEIMLNILFFIDDISKTGGTERVSIMLANMLNRSPKFKVSFVSIYQSCDAAFFELDQEIALYSLFNKPVRGITHYPTLCFRLFKRVNSLQSDLIIDVDGILDFYSLSIKKAAQVRVISWEHFNYHMNQGFPYRRITRRWASRAADAIVTLTEKDRENFINHLHKQKCPIVAIHNPLCITDIQNKHRTDSHIIMSAGRLSHDKGFDMLIKVAKIVLPQHPDWIWIVLGDGNERKNLLRSVEDNGLEGRVIFAGNKRNVTDYYNDAAIFVLTSRQEGLPMVLLEAKACGVPIVSFDCQTGPSDLIIENINGYLVKPFDLEGMANRIEFLIEHKSLRDNFADNSLQGTESFMPEYVLAQWIKMIESL